MQFRKKPVVIEAIQFTGENGGECLLFTGEKSGRIVQGNSSSTPWKAR